MVHLLVMVDQRPDKTLETSPPGDSGNAKIPHISPTDLKPDDHEAIDQAYDDLNQVTETRKFPDKHPTEQIHLDAEEFEANDELLYGTIHRGDYLTHEQLMSNFPVGEPLVPPQADIQPTDEPSATDIPSQIPDLQGSVDAEPQIPPPLQTGAGRYELVDGTEEVVLEVSTDTEPLAEEQGYERPDEDAGDTQTLTGANDNGLVTAGDRDAPDSDDEDDTLWDGRGDDQLADADRVLQGGDGADTLQGGSGDDTFYGGGGDDVMLGGDGNDVFYGGAGDDTASGDAGNDLFIFGAGDGTDSFSGGSGWTDAIQLDGIEVGPDDGVWTLGVDGGVDWTETDSGLQFDESASGSIELDDGSTLTFEDVERIYWS